MTEAYDVVSTTETAYNNDLINTILAAGISTMIISCLIGILMIVCYWILFNKAKKHGWAAIVPFYNSYVMFDIAFGNGILFLLMFVPIVNIVFSIMMCFKFATAFGKGTGFGFGLLFLPVVFYPILAFGSSKYVGVK